jgi:small redox-active disulfide protein 2
MEKNTAMIEVLGSGCPTCKKLYDLTVSAVQELNIGSKVEYVTNIQRIIDLGLMQSPVLVINNKPAFIGFTPDKEKLKQIIRQHIG